PVDLGGGPDLEPGLGGGEKTGHHPHLGVLALLGEQELRALVGGGETVLGVESEYGDPAVCADDERQGEDDRGDRVASEPLGLPRLLDLGGKQIGPWDRSYGARPATGADEAHAAPPRARPSATAIVPGFTAARAASRETSMFAKASPGMT